jgi:hypothetical protein
MDEESGGEREKGKENGLFEALDSRLGEAAVDPVLSVAELSPDVGLVSASGCWDQLQDSKREVSDDERKEGRTDARVTTALFSHLWMPPSVVCVRGCCAGRGSRV